MSPTVRHDRASAATDNERRVESGRPWAHTYAYGLLGAAVVVTVALVGAGASWPPPGPMLLLALPLTLCINRFVFYVNEAGVTADAAVVFAAVVGFRHDAIWLGPVLLALLAGPLDAKHWEERAFVRMAFNSGSTALVATTGVAAFLAAGELVGGSALAILAAALAAAVPAVAVELLLGVVLVTLQGEEVATAVRHQLPVAGLAVLLAILGAAAGLLVVPIGWWATALVLAPVALVPELVLVRLPRRGGASAVGIAAALLSLGVMTTVALATSPRMVPTVAVLAALAIVAGLELSVGRGRVVSPMVGVVVAATVAVASGAPLVALAAAAAGLATAVSWASAHRPASFTTALRGVCTASLAGAAGAVVAERVHPPASGFIAALLAAGCISVVVIAVDGARGRRAVRFLWGLPLVVVVAALGRVWGLHSDAVGVACSAAAIAAFAGAACFGAVPWPSRVLGAWGARRSAPWRRAALATAGLAAVVSATLAVVGPASASPTAGFLAIALAEAQVGMALLGVRQWRFAPRPRIVQTTVLAVASVAVAAAAGLLTTGDVFGAVAVFAAVVSTTAVALPIVDVERRGGQRNPESRNASR